MTAFQRPRDLLGATHVDECAARCGFARYERWRRSGDCGREDWKAVVLSVLRSIAAGYATGHVDCWDAAFDVAERELDGERAPLVVAHVAALVRRIRKHRDLVCLPSSCNRLSADERAILTVIAGGQDDAQLQQAGAHLGLDWRGMSAVAMAIRSAANADPVVTPSAGE
ncbi:MULTISPECIES: hypothetical protein [Bradyrhizobium]|jgi:hypothetical protein|uniref:hypothetical protein n=1 Tax=Bradyrhizobium TaxID=374 RepID=UPI0020238AB5|nr:hypothetical protein [Bradyrhizobium denitrificans]MCL8484358.1 hypothetical protein [Bradyrhizobium denitrificans]